MKELDHSKDVSVMLRKSLSESRGAFMELMQCIDQSVSTVAARAAAAEAKTLSVQAELGFAAIVP